MNAVKTNFFLEIIEEERENAATEESTARASAETTRLKNIRSNEKTLAGHFGKLIEKELAYITDGELFLESGELTGNIYSVVMADSNFQLKINGSPFEKFAHNGDAIRALAKILAKNPQPKPPVVFTEVTAEQRMRDAIKSYLTALDELKRVS